MTSRLAPMVLPINRNFKPLRGARHSPETTTKIFVDTTKLFVVGLRPDKVGRIDRHVKEGAASADRCRAWDFESAVAARPEHRPRGPGGPQRSQTHRLHNRS